MRNVIATNAIGSMNYFFLRYVTNREVFPETVQDMLQQFIASVENAPLKELWDDCPQALDMMTQEIIDGAYFDDMTSSEAMQLIRNGIESLIGWPDGKAAYIYERLLLGTTTNQ